ncbi:MAG: hypothetical protein ACJZ1S_04330, partial [Candidatus Neomarinimicrobiota bacterium]
MKHYIRTLSLFLFISFAFTQTQLGSDIDGEAAGDYFGTSVSMNSAGDRIAIGADYNDGTASDAGHVRVYEYSNSSWTQVGSDIDGEAASDLSGGSVSMNSAGDRVAIGAISNGGTASDAGHVRVYEYSNSSWSQLGSDIDGEAASDGSGKSVSINSAGDRVAIGGLWNDGTGTQAGHVRVYEYSNSSWIQLGSDIDGEAAQDHSGGSVSMNSAGDRVAIGAVGNDGTGGMAGHVRVYEYSNSSWTQIGSDIDGEAMIDYSGGSVSMNSAGDRVAIGATGNDGLGSDAGHVRVYEYSNSSWNQIGSDIDGEAAGDYSGISVSMNLAGDRVAIGATGNDGTANNAGHVRVYEYSNSSWTQLNSDIDGEAASNYSGWSVSMNLAGDRVAIGAYGNDGTGNDAGHVRVYSVSTFGCTDPYADNYDPTATIDDGSCSGYPDNGEYSLSFDGVDDYVVVSDDQSLNPTSAISISYWVKIPTNSSVARFVVNKGVHNSNTAADDSYMMRIHSTG